MTRSVSCPDRVLPMRNAMPMIAPPAAGLRLGDHRQPVAGLRLGGLRRSLMLLAVVLVMAAGGLGDLAAGAIAAPPAFDIKDFVARSLDAQGADYPVAGGHPHEVEVSFSIPSLGGGEMDDQELIKSTYVDSPAGFAGNPAVAARCTMAQLKDDGCPASSAVGSIDLEVNTALSTRPLYNMVAERGYPAQFGFKYFATPVVLYPRLRSRVDGFGITVASPGIAGIGIRL